MALWLLTSRGGLSRPVVGAGPQRSAAGILRPWDWGGVWLRSPGQVKIEHKESGCGTVGAEPLLFPHSRCSPLPFVMDLNLERGEKYGSKTGRHSRDQSTEGGSSDRNLLRGPISVVVANL